MSSFTLQQRESDPLQSAKSTCLCSHVSKPFDSDPTVKPQIWGAGGGFLGWPNIKPTQVLAAAGSGNFLARIVTALAPDSRFLCEQWRWWDSHRAQVPACGLHRQTGAKIILSSISLHRQTICSNLIVCWPPLLDCAWTDRLKKDQYWSLKETSTRLNQN